MTNDPGLEKKSVMTNHHKRGALEQGRLKNFEAYVHSEGHGLTVQAADEKAQSGAIFLQQIQEWQRTGLEPLNMKMREENIANLIWYMTKKSFEYGTPMDAGTYTLSLGTKEQTAFLNQYLKGKPGLAAVPRLLVGLGINALTSILNIIPGMVNLMTPKSWPKLPYFPPISKVLGLGINPRRSAYRRASSHFKKKVKKGHFGYDIVDDKNIIPGKFKSVVFGLLEDEGRIYIKPEQHGMDPIHNPGEAFLHSVEFMESAKNRGNAAKGRARNEEGQAGIESARKEHRIEDSGIIEKYKQLINKKRESLVNKKLEKNLGPKDITELWLAEERENIENLKQIAPRRYQELLLKKIAKLESKKSLSPLEKEIIKTPEYKSFIKLSKMSDKPRGDLDKMRADILQADGVSTDKEREDMLSEFDQAYISMHARRRENLVDELSPQHGDENAFTFTADTLANDIRTMEKDAKPSKPVTKSEPVPAGQRLAVLNKIYNSLGKNGPKSKTPSEPPILNAAGAGAAVPLKGAGKKGVSFAKESEEDHRKASGP